MRLTPSDISLGDKILDLVPTESKKDLAAVNELQKDLKKHKLSRRDSLSVLSDIMHNSAREVNKIAVAKIALTLNGDMKDNELQHEEKPTINFVFQDSNVNLQGIFNPQRS